MAGRSILELILSSSKRGDAAKQVSKDLRDLKKEGRETKEVFDVLGGAATKAGIALSAMSAAGVAFLGSATKLAARVETLGVVTVQLGKNIGMTEDQIRSLEQAIVSQGITLRKSREAIATMIQSEIELASATDLARLAQDTAVIANLDSSEAFRQLIAVITTGNVRMGRTLGLQLRFGVALDQGAKAIGKNVEELTDLEIIQIRTNEVMRQGEKISGTYEAAMETAGKQLLSLNRHVEESRRIIGETYLPIMALLVEGVTDALKAFEDMDAGQQRGIATAIGMTTAWSGLLGAGLLIIAQLPSLIKGFQALRMASMGVLGPIGLIVIALAAATTAIVSQTAANKAAREKFKQGEREIRNTAKSYKAYTVGIKDLAEKNNLVVVSQEEMNSKIRHGVRVTRDLAGVVVELSEAEWELDQRLERSNASARMVAESLGLLEDGFVELTPEVENTGTSFLRAESSARSFFDSVDLGLRTTIENQLENLRFLAAGGGELVALNQIILSALEKGQLTPEQAQSFWELLVAKATALDIKLGNLADWEGPRTLAEALDIPIREALTMLETIDGMTITPEMIVRATIGYRATAGTGEFAPPELAPSEPLPGIQADIGVGQRSVSTTVEKTEINNFLPGANITINRDLELRAFLNMLEQL